MENKKWVNQTPIHFLILIMASIILTEILIMLFIRNLSLLPIWGELTVDSILLSIIMLPAMYLFAYRPMTRIIEENKKTEEALRNSEERFRSMAQSAIDAIVTSNNKGIIAGWNNGAEKAFGYSGAEILGKPLSIIIPQEYIELHFKGINRVNSGGERHVIGQTVELYGLHKNGNTFPVELSLSEWETSEGKFFTGIIRDISRRKRAELEGQIFYDISKGITNTEDLNELMGLIHNSLAKVLYADNIFVALRNENTGLFSFPYFVDKLDPKPLASSMAKSCTAYVFRTVKPLLLTHEIFNHLKEQNEVELVGSPSPSWIGIPLKTSSRVIGVLVLQHYENVDTYTEKDLTFLSSIGNQIAIAIEHKKDVESIQLKNILLQTINEEKDKFFSIIAHDLRGPLGSFVGVTQMFAEEIDTMTTVEIKELTTSMRKDASNLYRLLENLLEWSRLKRGAVEFNPLVFNLKNTIEKGIEAVSASARKKKIEINISVPEDLSAFFDKHMFETVLRNLVSNAVKFTSVEGKICLSAYENQNNLIEIKISDTGIGMDRLLLSKLFLLNEKTNRKGTEGEPSSGLGLLLCKEFVGKNGGKIWAESEVGKGSTFFFSVPVVSA